MKIGIMTYWWWEDNYGQILQCYALQKYLRDAGHDAFLIRYISDTDIKPNTFLQNMLCSMNPKRLFNHFKYIINQKKVMLEHIANSRHFGDFRNKYIVQSEYLYNTYNELKNNPPQADVYIVGSDQVWNYWDNSPERYIGPINAFFLNFGNEKIKRLSYAASWGKENFSSKYLNIVGPLLLKFSYVTVREKNGINICKKCGYKNAELACDPTLLLGAKNYRKIINNEIIRKPINKYLLLYMLNNESKFDIQTIYNFAEKKKLDVIYVTGNGVVDKKNKYFATIPEWLYLIDNAEYIVTNSFHGSLFSVIFHKKFGIVPLEGRSECINNRFNSLFENFNIPHRYIKNGDFSTLEMEYFTDIKHETPNIFNYLS